MSTAVFENDMNDDVVYTINKQSLSEIYYLCWDLATWLHSIRARLLNGHRLLGSRVEVVAPHRTFSSSPVHVYTTSMHNANLFVTCLLLLVIGETAFHLPTTSQCCSNPCNYIQKQHPKVDKCQCYPRKTCRNAVVNTDIHTSITEEVKVSKCNYKCSPNP